MNNVIRELFVMYIIIAVGFGFNKKVNVSEDTKRTISQLIINITLPAMTVYSIMDGFNSEMIRQYMILVLAGLFVGILGLLISYSTGKYIFNIKNINVFSFLSSFGNTVYLGAPICYALFGSKGFIMALVFNLGIQIIIWTLGVWLVSDNIKSNNIAHNLKGLISPPLISIIVGIIIAYYSISLPKVIVETTELVGGVTVPLAMLFIGFNLSEYHVKEIIQNKYYYSVGLNKLIIIPFIVLFLLKQSNINQILLGVIILETGMPVAVNSSIILNKYAGKGEVASGSIFVTTFFFLFTLPILIVFI